MTRQQRGLLTVQQKSDQAAEPGPGATPHTELESQEGGPGNHRHCRQGRNEKITQSNNQVTDSQTVIKTIHHTQACSHTPKLTKDGNTCSSKVPARSKLGKDTLLRSQSFTDCMTMTVSAVSPQATPTHCAFTFPRVLGTSPSHSLVPDLK